MSANQSFSSKLSKYHLNDDQLLEIQQAFEIFDVDKSHLLDRNELRVALRSMGFEVSKEEIIAIMNRYDQEQKGYIDFDSFSRIAADKISQRNPETELHQLFLLFADQKLLKIGIDNLREVFESVNEKISEEDLKQMIECFDQDHDGYITEEEFVNIMKLQ